MLSLQQHVSASQNDSLHTKAGSHNDYQLLAWHAMH